MSATSYAPSILELSDYVKMYRNPSSPLVLIMPHSGREYDHIPHNLDLSRESVMRTVIAGIDHCVPEVTRAHEFEDATLIRTDLARTVVDVNRGRDDFDYRSVKGGSKEPKSQGIIWNATIASRPEDIKGMLKCPYTQKEFDYLMEKGYDPLERAVREAMARASERHETVILFDMHSIWANETSTVQEGPHLGAYLVGEPLNPPSLEEDGTPHLYLMTSKHPVTGENISCCPKLKQYILDHFRDHGLKVQERQVASPKFELAHRKYADRSRGYEVFAMEIIGHHGLERRRAEGELIFDPNPDYLKLLQQAFNNLFIGLRDLKFKR